MAFGYQQITISGATAGIEGTAKLIQETKNFMVNNLGWTLTDDQSTKASTSHKVVLQSNGESGTASTFYFIITSGTGATGAAAQSVVDIRAATAWNAATHFVPSSGTETPTASGTNTLTTSTNTNYTMWISGDKNSVVLITKTSTNYDGAYAGTINQFTSTSADPFPIYVVGSTAATDADTIISTGGNAYSFLSGTTALGAANNADSDSFYTTPVGSDESPQNIFGTSEAFAALPTLMGVSTATQRAIRGVAYNMWSCIASGTGPLASEDELATANGQVYKLFFNASATRALVIRKS